MTTGQTAPSEVRGGRVSAAPPRRADGQDGVQRLATGLGWFSIGLGLAEVLAPRGLARLIGVPDDAENRALLRALGLREIATGAGILTRPRPAGWVWGRVGGDVIDLALLGGALTSERSARGRVAAATASVVGVTLLDAYCGEELGRRARAGAEAAPTTLRHAISINRPPEEVYRFWRDVENFPRFMPSVESVRTTGDRRSHWRAKGPAGMHVEWDSEIVEDQPNALIAWRAVDGGTRASSGSVRFTPGPRGRGTQVLVEMALRAPGGALGSAAARLLGRSPERRVAEDLRRFKQLLETGEIATAQGPAGRSRPGLFGRGERR